MCKYIRIGVNTNVLIPPNYESRRLLVNVIYIGPTGGGRKEAPMKGWPCYQIQWNFERRRHWLWFMINKKIMIALQLLDNIYIWVVFLYYFRSVPTYEFNEKKRYLCPSQWNLPLKPTILCYRVNSYHYIMMQTSSLTNSIFDLSFSEKRGNIGINFVIKWQKCEDINDKFPKATSSPDINRKKDLGALRIPPDCCDDNILTLYFWLSCVLMSYLIYPCFKY